jgi:hypothetical protein
MFLHFSSYQGTNEIFLNLGTPADPALKNYSVRQCHRNFMSYLYWFILFVVLGH